jgi:CHRD domain-containing protein
MRSRWACLALLAATVPVSGQIPKTFKARLSPVPIDLTMQATVAGKGSLTATLVGTKLSVTGTFEGLRSPSTTAQVHKGPVAGVRGPSLFDLVVSKGTSGTITGSIDLTPTQVTDLEKGRLYVQLQSEKAPDGNLWGWLMPQAQETKR